MKQILKITQKKKQILLLIITFICFSLNFSINIFRTTDNNYKVFDQPDESNVISRFLMNETEGYFSYGAMTGNYHNYTYELNGDSAKIPHILSFAPNGSIADAPIAVQISQKYNDYIVGRKIHGGEYKTYKTMPGGQAMIYSALHKILPFDNLLKLQIYRLITIFLSALTFSLFVLWVSRRHGLTPAIITFTLIILSPWLIRAAYSLWWALWSYYIPFLTMLYILDKKSRNNHKVTFKKVYLLLFIAVFIKFFFTGAEFITATLIMSVCPIIYYLISEKLAIKNALFIFTKSCIASIGGLLLGFGLLCFQIKSFMGSWQAGIDHIVYSFFKRSVYSELSTEKIDVLQVVINYFGETPFHWNFFPHITFGFGWLVAIVSAFSIALYILSKQINKAKRQENTALIITTYIAILSPMSWVLFFTQHAIEHFFIDYITWYMPYCLYAYVVIGVTIDLIIKRIKRQ